jgi:hypothetical protein
MSVAREGKGREEARITCMGCFAFFIARRGVMSASWKEFCTQGCLDQYEKGGTNRTPSQIAYAQRVLKSVETRPDATGVSLATGALRC